MVYESPTNAVLAGLAVQKALEKYNTNKPNITENDVFGEAVNIAARIESITMPGEVFFTESVYLAMTKAEVPSSEVGLLQLKGVPEKVKVYKVKREIPVGGEESSPTGIKCQILNLFKTKQSLPGTLPKAVFAVYGQKSSIPRRAIALFIDLIICAILVSILFSSRKENVLMSCRIKEKNKIADAVKHYTNKIKVDLSEGAGMI